MTRPILLDTIILLWAMNDDRRLSRNIRAAIASPVADVRVSVVSAWEIAIKHDAGKIRFDVPIELVISRILSGTTWPVVPILPAHISHLLVLPPIHRDPFDRMLVAQARAEGMVLATSDSEIPLYAVPAIR